MAKQWLADCTCYKPSGARAWYPTRLLDCGIEGRAESTRLVETGSNTVDGAYMTLSHCWGDAKGTLKLTTENYDECLREIPMARLPQLYRDAVYVTRQLGVRYIWIDSICIIQRGDDLPDWHREVGLMERVYFNTFCNISALHAPDNHHSLFSTRNADLMCPQPIQLPYEGQQTTFLVRDDGYWRDELEHARLHTRGWVLQERFLSPRVLHFGRGQIFWECAEREISEVHGECQLTPDWLFKSLLPRDPDPNSNRGIFLYRNWEDIIEMFAKCRLTYPSDKLVALSAVAKHMSVLLQDEYCAGIWRGNMEEGLEWSVIDAETAHQDGVRETWQGPMAVYRAPSWSWASVDYPISHPMSHWKLERLETSATPPVWFRKLIEIEEVHIDHLARGFGTGLVKGGWLRLRAGALRAVTLVPRATDGQATALNNWGLDIDGFKSLGDEVFVSVMLDAPYEYQARMCSGGAGKPMQLYWLPTRIKLCPENKISTWYSSGAITCCFLLLQQAGEDRRGPIFRRIGLAVFRLPFGGGYFGRNFVDLCRALGGSEVGQVAGCTHGEGEERWGMMDGEEPREWFARVKEEIEKFAERLLANAQPVTII